MSLLKRVVVIMAFQCASMSPAIATIDDVWNSTPPTNDGLWAHQNSKTMSPGTSSDGGNYKISSYSGNWGSSADFGWHHWCALTAHTANGDRGTGWNIYPASFDASTGKSLWKVTYYNLSSWGATCYDVMP